jgi:CxxC motif-containing protein
MFEKERIQEAYVDSILNESSEMQVKKAIEKVFPVKVKKTDIKRKFVFHLSDFIDDEEMENFAKIDAVTDFIKKKYKGSIVSFKGRTIEVEEL